MKNRKLIMGLIVTFITALFCSYASAGVSQEEADRLKSDLTPVGAERAGNADGTIPEWTGGLKEIPAGITHNQGDFYPDPFADDKVLFSINSQNMDKHADKLNPGTIAMMKKYPETFRLDVYETRRTAAAPEWVYENTFKNATRASLSENLTAPAKAYGGIPFPIPKHGVEVISNHKARWQGASRSGSYSTGIVNAQGEFILGGGGKLFEQSPYYFKDGSIDTFNGEVWNMLLTFDRPARKKGELMLVKAPLNDDTLEPKIYQYLPGQRRVRRAPSMTHDTPYPGAQGFITTDDNFMWSGNPERFDWKIIGKKEQYIPYNAYKFHNADPKELLMKGHVNPDVVRWELHRVWVVEGTLKSGFRHCYHKRVYFFDEDTWNIVLKDQYDGRGSLWHTSFAPTFNHYDLPATSIIPYVDYDLQKNSYLISNISNYDKEYFSSDGEKGLDDKIFTPEYLRKLGRR